MTTYVKRQVQIQVSESQNGANLIFKRGDSPIKFDADDNLAEAEYKKYVLTLPVTDKDLLDGTTITAGRILQIETDTELTVKLDDTGDTGIVVKPVSSDDSETKRGVLYLEGNFTHVYITIAGTGEANVLMGAVGS